MAEKTEKSRKIELKEEDLIRILSTDIPGNKNVFAGLTKIKGVSWSLSNAICNSLGIDKKKKIQELSKEEVDKITGFIQNPKLPAFILNRRKDIGTGENKHLIGSDLSLQKEFDIRRIRQIRSYKGWRHALGQPVRGQRTKSHFRKNKSVGVMKKAKAGKKS